MTGRFLSIHDSVRLKLMQTLDRDALITAIVGQLRVQHSQEIYRMRKLSKVGNRKVK